MSPCSLSAPERGLSGGHTRHGYPVRRARHVVEPRVVEERDRDGVAAVLTAHPELELRVRLASEPAAHPHELADPRTVDRLERRAVDDAGLDVAVQDARLDVVAGEAQAGLREVVGPE